MRPEAEKRPGNPTPPFACVSFRSTSQRRKETRKRKHGAGRRCVASGSFSHPAPTAAGNDGRIQRNLCKRPGTSRRAPRQRIEHTATSSREGEPQAPRFRRASQASRPMGRPRAESPGSISRKPRPTPASGQYTVRRQEPLTKPSGVRPGTTLSDPARASAKPGTHPFRAFAYGRSRLSRCRRHSNA